MLCCFALPSGREYWVLQYIYMFVVQTTLEQFLKNPDSKTWRDIWLIWLQIENRSVQVAYALRPAGAGCLLPTCQEGTKIHRFQWLGLVSWITTAIERMTSQANHKAYCHPSSEWSPGSLQSKGQLLHNHLKRASKRHILSTTIYNCLWHCCRRLSINNLAEKPFAQ